MKKISIITACFNNEATIYDTLQAVTCQGDLDIEHIIIDGASTDNTCVVIKSQVEKFKSKIDYKCVSEPDNGIYDALNKGVKLATGEIIGFLHADDIFYNEKVIEKIAQAFEDTMVDAVYGDLQYVARDNPNRIIRNWKSNPFDVAKLKKGWMPPHPTLYLKKAVYEKYGEFDLNYNIAADYDFMLRILSKGIKTCYLPEYFVKMRIGGKSNNLKNLINKMNEDVKALRKNKVGGFYSLFLKNITKIPQFFKR